MDTLFTLFIICMLGYILGMIKFFGLQLGSSAILLVALVFGHFGAQLPSIIRDIGIVFFVATVGLIAGPAFISSFRKHAFSFIIIGCTTILAGSVLTIAAIRLFDIPIHLGLGIFAGALTSTPALAAAMEALDSSVSVGYGIAYPFGVVGVVLFVQLIPKILKININEESNKITVFSEAKTSDKKINMKKPDISFCFIILFATSVIGMLIGKIKIPLLFGTDLTLGNAGGPLFAGLIIGYFVNKKITDTIIYVKQFELIREIGLMLFLTGAGLSAGTGFIETIRVYGANLFMIGIVITLVPMVLSWFVARLLKLDVFNALGSICGAMTSTPALGSLISTAKSDTVSIPYAATYPISLILVVLSAQLIPLFF